MIMTLAEGLEVLHLDAGVQDALVTGLIEAIPGYIEETTGMTAEAQAAEPLAKTVAGFLLVLWYNRDHADDVKLQRVIDNLLKCIRLKVAAE